MSDEKNGFSVVWVKDSEGNVTIPVAAKAVGAFLIHLTVGEVGWSVTHGIIGATFAVGLTREDAGVLASSLTSPAWDMKTRTEAIQKKQELQAELQSAIALLEIPGEYSTGGNFHADYA